MDSSLENFIEDVSGDQYLRVQDDLGHGFVRLRAAEAQRRQAKQDIRSSEDVIIELLRNARDAHATTIFIASWTEGEKRYITILDDGDGIPPDMHSTVFEPFVTSKLDSFHADKWGVHGRGMALYSIQQNTEDAHIVASAPGLGSVFSITTNTSELPEKRDQSTIPSINKDAQGKSVLRGPHNIIRTVLEFAIEERSSIALYYGSCASIVSTLYNLGSSAAQHLSSIFDTYDANTPYLHRFAYTFDAESLSALATSLGFPISTRTAHRIINGEIEPLPLHLELLTKQTTQQHNAAAVQEWTTHGNQFHTGTKQFKFTKEDLETFSQEIRRAYSSLAHAYYLDASIEPRIQTKGNELIVKIPLELNDSDR